MEKAVEIMTQDMKGSFDPNLLELFFSNMKEVLDIKRRLED